MKIKQLSVFIENRTGRINEVARILGENNINMTAFSLAENADFGILRMIVSDVDNAVRVLKEARLGASVTDVICLDVPNMPGAMSKILEYLAKEDVFIEYMYAFSHGETASVIIRPTDIELCLQILSAYEKELFIQKSLINI